MLWLMANFFDRPINSELKSYKNILSIATGQQDDYITGCLLDYSYFKENYKMISMDLFNYYYKMTQYNSLNVKLLNSQHNK